MTADSLGVAYCADVGRHRLLTAAEERDLARRARHGDGAARERLVLSNLRLVVSIARRYHQKGLPLEDLVAEGNVGLLRAADRFEPELGHRFSTYATWWVKQAIRRALGAQVRIVHIPYYLADLLRRLREKAAELHAATGHELSFSEVAEALGLSCRKRRLLQAALAAAGVTSLDQVPWDPAGEEPVLDRRLIAEEVEEALARLDPRSARVLRRRCRDGMTLVEVGAIEGLTKERVRQIQNEALEALRRVAS